MNGRRPVAASNNVMPNPYTSVRASSGSRSELLGRRVGGRPGRQRGRELVGRGCSGERDAEVGRVEVAVVVDQHVGRLHVTVDHSGPVRGVQCRTDLFDQSSQRALIEPPGRAPPTPATRRRRSASRGRHCRARASSRRAGTMCGCSSAATVWASVSKRRMNSGWFASSARICLIATLRSSDGCAPRHTSENAPSPITSSSW